MSGVVSDIYYFQKVSSKKRGHAPPLYTRDDLYKWMLRFGEYEKLFSNWVKSGYLTEFKPSVDRLDDYKGYCLNNIRLTTWGKNRSKSHRDMKSGANNKLGRPVVQINKLTGELISEFKSISIASRFLNKRNGTGSISACATGKRKSAYGYVWKFKDD